MYRPSRLRQAFSSAGSDSLERVLNCRRKGSSLCTVLNRRLTLECTVYTWYGTWYIPVRVRERPRLKGTDRQSEHRTDRKNIGVLFALGAILVLSALSPVISLVNSPVRPQLNSLASEAPSELQSEVTSEAPGEIPSNLPTSY